MILVFKCLQKKILRKKGAEAQSFVLSDTFTENKKWSTVVVKITILISMQVILLEMRECKVAITSCIRKYSVSGVYTNPSTRQIKKNQIGERIYWFRVDVKQIHIKIYAVSKIKYPDSCGRSLKF